LTVKPVDYNLSLKAYGWNGVSDPTQVISDTYVPHEVGVLLSVTAISQEMATQIAKLSNPYLLHFPLQKGGAMPTFAFPFSPAEVERGQVFEFSLNHIVEVETPFDLVRFQVMERECDVKN